MKMNYPPPLCAKKFDHFDSTYVSKIHDSIESAIGTPNFVLHDGWSLPFQDLIQYQLELKSHNALQSPIQDLSSN